MVYIKPGEKKILDALIKKPQHFSEMSKKNGRIKNPRGIMNPSILSKYLKDLQRKGFIEKTIEDGTYKIKNISFASLLLNDVSSFIQEYLESVVNEDLKAENKEDSLRALLLPEKCGSDWLFLLEKKSKNNLQEMYMHQFKRNPDVMEKLIDLETTIREVYKKYVLSSYPPKQKQIIEMYEKYLYDFVKLCEKTQSEEMKKNIRDFHHDSGELELQMKYPGVVIPEEMIEIEAKRDQEKLNEIGRVIETPFDFKDIPNRINSLRKMGLLRDTEDFSEKEEKELEELFDFLEDNKNRKLYEKYKERLNNEPKNLLVHTSSGFNGYMQKINEIAKDFKTKQ
ncbi:MAG: hypothetical protein IAX21_00650 [Candidatus Bathyarchaeota archaeon]|nr:MAG: hypothetical protein IAX21_00650 [Candidatus Bathyarchaeota archaeon]